jgi:hypothetical protein
MSGEAPSKQLAGDIGLSEKTVKVHRSRLMRKMAAGSLPELSRMADKLKVLQKARSTSRATPHHLSACRDHVTASGCHIPALHVRGATPCKPSPHERRQVGCIAGCNSLMHPAHSAKEQCGAAAVCAQA